MKTHFQIPARDEVSPEHQALFDNYEKALGFVPNLYAVLAHSPTGLSTFLNAQNAKSSLTAKEKEVVNLVVSQVNDCDYCLSAHTVIANKFGFSDEEIMEIRRGSASFNAKLDALAKLSKSITENKGHADLSLVDSFLNAGFSKGNVMDVILLIGIRSVANYVYAITDVEIDWPVAQELEEV